MQIVRTPWRPIGNQGRRAVKRHNAVHPWDFAARPLPASRQATARLRAWCCIPGPAAFFVDPVDRSQYLYIFFGQIHQSPPLPRTPLNAYL